MLFASQILKGVLSEKAKNYFIDFGQSDSNWCNSYEDLGTLKECGEGEFCTEIQIQISNSNYMILFTLLFYKIEPY